MGSTHCSTSMFSLRETLFSFWGNKFQFSLETNTLEVLWSTRGCSVSDSLIDSFEHLSFSLIEEEERDESPPESPVSDNGRGVDGSEEDVGHLRQVKKLKTSDNMEVDLTQIPTVEASDREKKDTSGLAISESPTAGSSSKRNQRIDSCLLNTIYCNDPEPNEVIKNKPGSRGRRIITYSLLGVFR
ncbi:BnaC01g43140D [Brassica napus]|uniref:BnaC01g43140D protein n=1 Tax=Brassica napus TaxID=3708 RepID=A0A078ISN7_BRANA|nr:BnaC01g43140D [Brassica napus]